MCQGATGLLCKRLHCTATCCLRLAQYRGLSPCSALARNMRPPATAGCCCTRAAAEQMLPPQPARCSLCALDEWGGQQPRQKVMRDGAVCTPCRSAVVGHNRFCLQLFGFLPLFCPVLRFCWGSWLHPCTPRRGRRLFMKCFAVEFCLF